jgi:hypothetical protein
MTGPLPCGFLGSAMGCGVGGLCLSRDVVVSRVKGLRRVGQEFYR